MKQYILGLSGSPRADGNTDAAVREALLCLEAPGNVKKEFLRVSEFDIQPCAGCRGCMTLNRCAIQEDQFEALMDRVRQASVLVIGAPVYWLGPPGVMKNFIDRTHAYYAWGGAQLLRGQRVGLISVAADSGFEPHEACMESWLRHYGAHIIGRVRVLAREKDDLLQRPEEMEKVRALARQLTVEQG